MSVTRDLSVIFGSRLGAGHRRQRLRSLSAALLATALIATAFTAINAPAASAASAAVVSNVPGVIQAEDYVDFYDTDAGNRGQASTYTDDVDVWPMIGGGYILGRVLEGEFTTYDISVAEAGTYQFEMRHASGAAQGGTATISIDGLSIAPPTELGNSNGWWRFRTTSLGTAFLTAGNHVLRVDWGPGQSNFDHIDITRLQGVIGEAANPEVLPFPASIPAHKYSSYGDSTAGNSGTAATFIDDVDVWSNGSGYILGDVFEGEFTTYDINVSEAGTFNFRIVHASGGDGGTVTVSVDGIPLAAPRALGSTGDWWSFYRADIGKRTLSPGIHEVRVDWGPGQSNFARLDVLQEPGGSGEAANASRTAVPGIVEAENYDQFADLDAGNAGQASTFTDDVDVWPMIGGGYILGRVLENEYTTYDISVADDGYYEFEMRHASGSVGGTATISVDGRAIAPPTELGNTNGWWRFETSSLGTHELSTGNHTVRVDWGPGQSNVDYIEVSAIPSPPQDLTLPIRFEPLPAENGEPRTAVIVEGGGQSLGAVELSVTFDATQVDVTGCDVEMSGGSCNLSGREVRGQTELLVGGYQQDEVPPGDVHVATLEHRPGGGVRAARVAENAVDDSPFSGEVTFATNDASETISGSVEPLSANAPDLMGDANCDGVVNILDAFNIAEYSVDLLSAWAGPCAALPGGHLNLPTADPESDLVVNIGDAARVAQCSVGLSNDMCPAVDFDFSIEPLFSTTAAVSINYGDSDLEQWRLRIGPNEWDLTPDNVAANYVLEPGQSYEVLLYPYVRSGVAIAEPRKATVTMPWGDSAPAQPIAEVYATSETSITMFWGYSQGFGEPSVAPDDSGIAFYLVTVDGQPLDIRLDGTARSYTIERLFADTQYSIQVLAVDDDGNISRSVVKTVSTDPRTTLETVPQPDETPPRWTLSPYSSITVTDLIRPGAVRLTWCCAVDWGQNDHLTVASFDVYIKTGSLDWTKLNPVAGGSPSMEIYGLVENQEYSIMLVAVDRAGNRSEEALVRHGVVARPGPSIGPAETEEGLTTADPFPEAPPVQEPADYTVLEAEPEFVPVQSTVLLTDFNLDWDCTTTDFITRAKSTTLQTTWSGSLFGHASYFVAATDPSTGQLAGHVAEVSGPSALLTGLSAGTEYQIQVTAFDSAREQIGRCSFLATTAAGSTRVSRAICVRFAGVGGSVSIMWSRNPEASRTDVLLVALDDPNASRRFSVETPANSDPMAVISDVEPGQRYMLVLTPYRSDGSIIEEKVCDRTFSTPQVWVLPEFPIRGWGACGTGGASFGLGFDVSWCAFLNSSLELAVVPDAFVSLGFQEGIAASAVAAVTNAEDLRDLGWLSWCGTATFVPAGTGVTVTACKAGLAADGPTSVFGGIAFGQNVEAGAGGISLAAVLMLNAAPAVEFAKGQICAVNSQFGVLGVAPPPFC